MIEKMIDGTVFPKESKNVSVGSGIIQSSYYLIAISSNTGCMDFGFIVGGEEPLYNCQARESSIGQRQCYQSPNLKF